MLLFERVFVVWDSLQIDNNDLANILYAFSAITFESKKRQSNVEFKEVATTLKEVYSAYDFNNFSATLFNWIVKGEWDAEAYRIELKKQYTTEEIPPEQKFLWHNFWDLTQEDIDIGMPISIKKAYNGNASCDELVSILQKINILKVNDIPLPCQVSYKKLEEGFEIHKAKIRNGEIHEPRSGRFTFDDEIEEAAIPLNREIENLEDELIIWNNRQSFLQFLKQDTETYTYEFCKMQIDFFDTELKEAFLAKYFSASNGLKRHLSLILIKLHYERNQHNSQKNLQITIQNLKDLCKAITSQMLLEQDGITVAIERHTIKAVQSIVEKLNVSVKNTEKFGSEMK